MKLRFSVSGIGLAGGGLGGWTHCRQWLESGRAPGEPDPPSSSLLSPRERRRSPLTVRQALAVAEQACGMAGIAPDSLPAVFASGMGDLDITHYMCGILADSPELISPTRFHNSVHNAAAGYWNIGAGTHADVTALCAYEDSFAAGLLEAVLRCVLNEEPILLVCYDIPATGPLEEVWTVKQSFAGALVLTPIDWGDPGPGLGELQQTEPPGASNVGVHKPAPTYAIRFSDGVPSIPNLPEPLHNLARDNPAARMLYLLTLITGSEQGILLETRQGPNLELCRV